MVKIEKEVKILDIDVSDVRKKLTNIEAEFKGEKNQKIFVYDVPTLYYRFLEIKQLLNSDDKILINTNIKKLETLLLEFGDLIEEEKLEELLNELNVNKLKDLINLPIIELRTTLQNEKLGNEFINFQINPNKWVRLRESNGITELTTKHILDKKTDKLQQVIETEVEISSLDEGNLILESIGLARRSYQEKIRYSYKYKNAEIEIDIWPMLNPYLEIETDDETLMSEIISILELENKEIVSLNTEQLYKRINIDVHKISDLKFQ